MTWPGTWPCSGSGARTCWPAASPPAYRQTVATTWRLAFEHLQADPPAAGLLRLLANCAPEAIPLHLLLHPRPGLGDSLGPEIAPVLLPLLEDPLAAKDAVAALRRHSLISPPAAGTVSVHRLVQAVTIAQMPAGLAAAWQQAAAAVIAAALPATRSPAIAGPRSRRCCPTPRLPSARTAGSMLKIVSYLGYSGNYPAARDLQQRVLQARVSGPEHPDTLIGRGSLALWTGHAGDAAKARDLFAALVPVDERVFGPEDPETLGNRAHLAGLTGRAGDPGQPRRVSRPSCLRTGAQFTRRQCFIVDFFVYFRRHIAAVRIGYAPRYTTAPSLPWRPLHHQLLANRHGGR